MSDLVVILGDVDLEDGVRVHSLLYLLTEQTTSSAITFSKAGSLFFDPSPLLFPQ